MQYYLLYDLPCPSCKLHKGRANFPKQLLVSSLAELHVFNVQVDVYEIDHRQDGARSTYGITKNAAQAVGGIEARRGKSLSPSSAQLQPMLKLAESRAFLVAFT
jgi:hypothetical protein